MRRLIPMLAMLALAACATRPVDTAYRQTWAVFDAEASEGDAVKLVYGVPESDVVDLFAVCDREAQVFELAFFTADDSGAVAEGTRTQLLVGPPEKVTPLMAVVQYWESSREMVLVARTTLPPTFVRDWVNERVTLAGQGTAMTLLARPGKAMIEDFLARCAA